MIQRNILLKLETWAKSDMRKPLVLRGARQVGKTTLVEEFGKQFDNYLYLNLENEYESEIFSQSATIHEIVNKIFLYKGKVQDDQRTLIFIDEIQNSPKAVTMLRYFYENYPKLHVISAGSLLETLINTQISFPVGRVQYMALRPCSFSEFLDAMGHTEIKKAIDNCDLPTGMNSFVMSLFNTFSFVGGMPEAVSNYAKNQDIVRLRRVYSALINGYKDDVEKYAKTELQRNVLRVILSKGWTQASQQISLGNFAETAYKSREMGEAFRMLEKTFLLELSYPTTTTSLPILQETKRKPRLFWLDTGLVNYVSGTQQELVNMRDLTDVWKGKIAEHIVAQELIANSDEVSDKRNFWVRNSRNSMAEVDFVQNIGGQLIPIEVKSGHNAHLRSLHQFMNMSKHDIAVRVWSNPFSIDEVKTPDGKIFKLYNVPYYYVSNLEKLLEKQTLS